ncbi:HPr(Ser) kinase/phosphatase [Mesomycoplasma neurolyticum]|uniref:HPr kinase/phosphorylase n=1 Tax=Mesomycoplasma neurolyticum TaxID=2120 RepID=A0A449A4A8_9BACT|nr:HPr(Ser) kinase/phosphatase [Mesomycoplasma neurolyticum]VEU59076.1 HPr kinase/phosphorylase [Mesomycoplasma neurolyticum]
MKKISVKEIIKDFNLEVLNDFSEGYIKRPSIKRLGLLLGCGFSQETISLNLAAWGTDEAIFLESLEFNKRKKILNKIFKLKPPALLLSVGFIEKATEGLINELITISNQFAIPLVKSKEHLSTLMINIGTVLSEQFVDSVNVHGCAVVVNGIGVLIIGESGVGKSETVLELIQKGFTFVSDDTVTISRLGHMFIGKPAKITRDILEVRGIGLIDIRKIYGVSKISYKTKIDLVLELINYSNKTEFDRLGNDYLKYEILNSYIPKKNIPVNKGRTVSDLVVAAVNTFIAAKHGIDAVKKIQERIQEN